MQIFSLELPSLLIQSPLMAVQQAAKFSKVGQGKQCTNLICSYTREGLGAHTKFQSITFIQCMKKLRKLKVERQTDGQID
jgi:hypothetical protein